ncbi:hypothetical protein PybrP1_009101 [[Pythium] brassicae (nom. inval.)]|nr:hypothetical protein PybrP1_009101 [[Pythium] brassicae (nom. inval.)]
MAVGGGDAQMHVDSRSLTLIACLERLRAQLPPAPPASPALTVLVLGADHREGNTPLETSAVFAAFLRWLAARSATAETHATLRLALVGPNVARQLHETRAEQHWTALGRAAEDADDDGDALRVQLSYFVGSFDAFAAARAPLAAPDLAVCFNAGVWGYDEWLPSLQLLLHAVRAPLLVTSYNAHEAQDDEDALEALAPRWFWRAEKNPHGSRTLRATRNALGSELRENDHWMCLGPLAGAS